MKTAVIHTIYVITLENIYLIEPLDERISIHKISSLIELSSVLNQVAAKRYLNGSFTYSQTNR